MEKKAIGQLWSSHHATFSQISRSPGRRTLVYISSLPCIFAKVFSFVRVIDTANEVILLLSRTWIMELSALSPLHTYILSLARFHQTLWEHQSTGGYPAVRMTC